MKKEFLKELGLTDEQIEKVFAENGKDINAEKDRTADYKSKFEDFKKKFEDAQQTISDLKDASEDTSELKRKLGEYEENERKRKEETEKAEKAEILKNRFEAVIGEKHKFINDFTKNGILAEFESAIADKSNTGKSDKEIYDALVKDREGIFVNPNQIMSSPSVSEGNPSSDTNDNSIRAIMGLPLIQ